MSAEPAPVAAFTRGKLSVVHARAHWYIVATADELGATPLARTLMSVPLVLFRDRSGAPVALLDRCPHRNVPLSLGRVREGELECAYHGWRFDSAGHCMHVPSLDRDAGDNAARARQCPHYATRELDGFVWVYATPGISPANEPYRFPQMGAAGYTTVRQRVHANATMFSTIENALDVPHTAFLHRGLFRAESRGIRITAVVRRSADRVEAEYVGEPRPEGVVAKLLSPSGGTVVHFDRFILPSIAQVEYRIGNENHLLVSSAMTPVSDFETDVYAVVSFRSRLPGRVIEPLVKPIALRIFKQDAEILAAQTKAIQQFGGEQFASTEIDVVGKHVWRLLRAAERGEVLPPDEILAEERVTLVV